MNAVLLHERVLRVREYVAKTGFTGPIRVMSVMAMCFDDETSCFEDEEITWHLFGVPDPDATLPQILQAIRKALKGLE